MSVTQQWSTLIILSSAVCALIEFLIPSGNLGKVMNSILGLFMLCSLILPFNTNKMKWDFKIKNIEINKLKHEKEFQETIENQTENFFKNGVKSIISGILQDIKINPERIIIFTDKNENECISIIKCKIFVDKREIEKSEEIKNQIEKKLGIRAEVESIESIPS